MKFVRIGLLLAATLGFVQTASAADMPLKAAPVVAPVATWSGWYAGVHVGYGWEDPRYTFQDPSNLAFAQCGPCFNPFSAAATDTTSGFIGGAHFGYNWQLNPTWLVGVEGDFTWTGMSSSASTPLITSAAPVGTGVPFVAAGTGLTGSTDINWLASLRGRLGYTTGPWLLYGTAGAAWLDYDFTGSAVCGAPTCGATHTVSTSFSNTVFGWTAGAGAEWQIPASNWRARAEYLYYRFAFTDFGQGTWTTGGAASACRAGVSPCGGAFGVGDIELHTVRFGLSYAFR